VQHTDVRAEAQLPRTLHDALTDWRLKALAFRVLEHLPMQRTAYALLQRHVTRSYPREHSPTRETSASHQHHLRAFRERFGPLDTARLFEFGAGWDLYGNLVFWTLGINHQTVMDLSRWVRPGFVNGALKHLMAEPPEGAVRIPTTLLPEGAGFDRSLEQTYGIRYLAPADARDSRLPAGSVDLVATTSTLEHIPPPDLRAILRETRRLCHPRSVVSHIIDYSDHFAHGDRQISVYNFLRFRPQEWARFNSAFHFQNRLRHRDFRPLFEEAGFEVADEYAEHDADAAEQLASVPLAEDFRRYRTEEILPRVGRFVLRPAAEAGEGRGR
jgi:hypothetical protein